MADRYDVVVVGAGNAGMSAALSATEQGAKVLVLERAPEHERGGDTAYTGGLFRFPFTGMDDIKRLIPEYSDEELANIEIPPYTQDAFVADIDRVCERNSNEELVQTLVGNAYETMRFLHDSAGIRWMLATGRQAYKVGDRYRFFGNLILEANGGGQGLSDQLFKRAGEVGIEVLYRARGQRLETDEKGRVTGVEVRTPDGTRVIPCSAVVLASGGFQANVEWRARYLGPEWDLAKVRGTKYDTGDGIRMALDIGARAYGHWSACHAVAWDLLAPETGDLNVGDLFQKHSYPIGLIVNRDGKRFVDEGADLRNYTYAKYGREILKQPGRQAFQLFDSKTIPLLRDEYRVKNVTKMRADTIEELAEQMEVNAQVLRETIDAYNAAVQDTPFNPSILDGKASRPEGQPPKSNWALRLDEPPFEAYAVTCGITFTFGGLRINPSAEVLDIEDAPIPGLYAAGELIGGLFYYNYPGGSGLMAGAVFGRRAGLSAASFVKGAAGAAAR